MVQKTPLSIMQLVEAHRPFRNHKVDELIERLFGKPDFSRSWINEEGIVITPLAGKKAIWRLD